MALILKVENKLANKKYYKKLEFFKEDGRKILDSTIKSSLI
jgi:hypothetical protein